MPHPSIKTKALRMKMENSKKVILTVVVIAFLCFICGGAILLSPKGNSNVVSTPSLSTAMPFVTETIQKNPVVTAEIPSSFDSKNVYSVHFIDIGQGDAELIITPNKKTILIDGGEEGTGILDYLNGIGVTQIDVMVATHPHSDHIGGLVDLFESSFPVKKVITSGWAANTNLFEKFLDGIESSKAEYVEVQRGDTFVIDGMTFYVVSPTKDYISDNVNNMSLVILMKENGVSFLFTGDQAFDAEENLLSSGIDINADFLKVGHHGSSTSTSDAFLNAVSPKIAIYSAGIGNKYNHPSDDAISRLKNVVQTIYGTDKDGTIVVNVLNGKYNIETGKGINVPMVAVPSESAIIENTPSTSNDSFSLDVISVTSPVIKGNDATLTIKTMPGAKCTIAVYYKSGISKTSGLEDKVADSNGMVSWNWTVSTKTSSGTWNIVITADNEKETLIKKTTFTVK